MKIENVLITGAGFLTRGLVRTLLARGVQRICIYSRGEYNQFLLRQHFGDDPRLRWMIGDVRDYRRLRMAVSGVDTVIHGAALKRVEVGTYNPHEMVQTNITGTQNVAEAAAETGVSVAVLISSDKAVEATNAYGASKAVAEHLWVGAHSMNLGPCYVAVRYGNVAGSTGSIIPIWRAATGEVEVRDTMATRFWITLDHACEEVMEAAQWAKAGGIWLPKMPAFRVADLAEAMGKSYRVTRLLPGEKLHESIEPGRTSEDAPRMTVDQLREALKHV